MSTDSEEFTHPFYTPDFRLLLATDAAYAAWQLAVTSGNWDTVDAACARLAVCHLASNETFRDAERRLDPGMHISDLRERLNYCERLRITSFQAWREITNEIIDGVMKEVTTVLSMTHITLPPNTKSFVRTALDFTYDDRTTAREAMPKEIRAGLRYDVSDLGKWDVARDVRIHEALLQLDDDDGESASDGSFDDDSSPNTSLDSGISDSIAKLVVENRPDSGVVTPQVQMLWRTH